MGSFRLRTICVAMAFVACTGSSQPKPAVAFSHGLVPGQQGPAFSAFSEGNLPVTKANNIGVSEKSLDGHVNDVVWASKDGQIIFIVSDTGSWQVGVSPSISKSPHRCSLRVGGRSIAAAMGERHGPVKWNCCTHSLRSILAVPLLEHQQLRRSGSTASCATTTEQLY
jgi:hypothetical protein